MGYWEGILPAMLSTLQWAKGQLASMFLNFLAFEDTSQVINIIYRFLCMSFHLFACLKPVRWKKKQFLEVRQLKNAHVHGLMDPKDQQLL